MKMHILDLIRMGQATRKNALAEQIERENKALRAALHAALTAKAETGTPVTEKTDVVQQVVDAAINLVEVRGRHHAEIAMKLLIDAVKAYKETSK